MATPLLSAQDLTKSYPSNILFEDVSLTISSGERMGMIGPNGAGKSTLLKVLAGLEARDTGEVTRQRNTRIVYIAQDDRFEKGATPISAVLAGLEDDPEHRVDNNSRAAKILSRLGFQNFDRPVDTLSGGWRKRLSLACGLANDPDVLMLDEPTNHLDLEGVVWLEQFVKQASMAMIFVTHDRKFLENTATRIIELSAAYPGGTFEANGNYSEFVRRKAKFLDAQAAAQSAIANKVRRDTAWLQQGIQGRQTRNKTQVRDAAERRKELRNTKDRNAAPSRTTAIDFQATQRKTRKLLALHSVAKSMGEKPLFSKLDLILSPGQRIGLLGVNGAGKTTLLRLLSGELQPDSGTIKQAADLKIVTFSQHRGTLIPEQTLQEALCPVGDTVDYRGKPVHVSSWAKRFLFETDQLSTFVGNLSGGEQARVLIANLMLEPADILLLDEPTNDLDIPSLEVLEQALLEFPGAMVFVTHDRFMLERIATEYIGLDDSGNAKPFMTFQQWFDACTSTRHTKTSTTTKSKAKEKRPRSGKQKLSYNQQREYDTMEETILQAETTVEELETAAAEPRLAEDHARSAETYQALSEAQQRVKALYARWAELEALQKSE